MSSTFLTDKSCKDVFYLPFNKFSMLYTSEKSLDGDNPI